MTVKQAQLEPAASIDENATWDEVYARLELRRKIEASEAEIQRGDFVSNEDVLAEIDQWLKELE